MKKGIIVVSFGTSYADTRASCIDSIENLVKEQFKDEVVLGAYTSEIVRGILEKRDKIFKDNVPSALEKMKKEGIGQVFVQPLHIIKGHEYEKVKSQIDEFLQNNGDFDIRLSVPLLSDQASYERVVEALEPKVATVVYMGHGSDHEADDSYETLEETFRAFGFEGVHIGTVEGSRSLESILPILRENELLRLELRPLMLVAGDHAINDMASDEEDSWKSILEKEGFQVELVLEGLGQNSEIQRIFLDKLEKAIKQ